MRRHKYFEQITIWAIYQTLFSIALQNKTLFKKFAKGFQDELKFSNYDSFLRLLNIFFVSALF